MRSGPAAIAASLLALALILSGCGGEQTTATPSERSTAKTAPVRTHPWCRRSLGEFLDSMESLDNSLAVGLGYDAYLTAVNHVRATYAPIQADRLPLLCLAVVASPAERALNAYIEAANAWGDCLATTSCDPESIEPRLQRRWSDASKDIALALSSLESD